MPLHDQARAVLDAMVRAGVAPIGTLPPVEFRAAVVARRVPPRRPEPIHHVEDRVAVTSAGPLPVRVYRPSAEAGLPILVWFHGGGWVIGDLDGPDLSLRKISNRARCVVVSVDYRLAPEHRFPAAVEDCFAATRWVGEHATELGGDRARLAVGGDSAGGNLAAVVALIARETGLLPLVHQSLVYPVTNFDLSTPSYADNGDGYLLTRAAMKYYWAHYLGPDSDGSDWRASPLRAADLSGLPSAHVVTAEFDPLRDEGEAYASALRDAGVRVVAKRYDGMIHGFLGMTEAIDDAERMVTEVATELREAFARR